jgi:hypothetical protein
LVWLQWAHSLIFRFRRFGQVAYSSIFRSGRLRARHVLWWDVEGVSVYGSIIMPYLFFHLELGIISTTCNPKTPHCPLNNPQRYQPVFVWLCSCQRINLFTLDTFPFDKTRHHSCQRGHRNSYFKRSIQTLCVCNEDIV